MKKLLVLVVVAFLATTNAASAQMQVQQNIWRSDTTIAVFNETSLPIVIFTDGRPMCAVAPRESWSQRLGGGVWPLYSYDYSRSLVVEVRVCEELTPVMFSVAPPAWTANRELLGPFSIVPSDAKIGETELHAKVRNIERFLEKRKPLGWRAMRREIQNWFRVVSTRSSGAKCLGPLITAGEVHVRGSNYGWYGSGDNRSAIVFYVREKGGGGYSVERVGNAYGW